MPRTAVVTPPARKLSRCGMTFTNALAGATTLAAMLVLSVATMSPTKPALVAPTPPTHCSSSTGSAMGAPNNTTVALVTTRATAENKIIVSGRPSAWPASCDAWLDA